MLLLQAILIYCGVLIDGTGAAPRREVSLLVEAGKIVRIEAGYLPAQPGQRVVDHKAHTVLPGLIDCHVHMDHEHSEDDLARETSSSPADMAFLAAVWARRTLEAGFTTVRDLGGTGVNLSLRDAIRRGLTPGPRIVCAGVPIGSTGSHMDPANGFNPVFSQGLIPSDGVADGADKVRQAVRRQIQHGVDVIKIAATGGVLSLVKDGTRPQFSQAEMDAVVQTATDYGIRVAAHAHGAEGMKRALRAGVASIEHGTLMDDECIALFKKTGAWYVPTLTAGRSVADSARKPGHYSPMVTEKALALGPKMAGTFSRAYKAGVRIAFGTDAGVFAHGLNWLEFKYMTEAGMPALEAITAATRSAADLCGLSATVGTLTPGLQADVIAVTGNPLQDITALSRVVWVMQAGKVVKGE